MAIKDEPGTEDPMLAAIRQYMDENQREFGDEATHATKNAGQFQSGQHRGGMPRVNTDSPLDERIRSRTENGQSVIEFLINVMTDKKERTNHRIAAAEQLLLRGYGKPSLQVNMTGEFDVTEHILLEFADEELEKRLEA